MGGEKLRLLSWILSLSGSPPRGRGKAWLVPLPLWRDRITPAWAGKSCPDLLKVFSARDHPRVGGEKYTTQKKHRGRRGSPPRGRGKVSVSIFSLICARITPAWAGKSRIAPKNWGSSWDHPRVGGEKPAKHAGYSGPLGSPPRGRGKAGQPVFVGVAYGITPAWAGKRFADFEQICSSQDHPRVGGEKLDMVVML